MGDEQITFDVDSLSVGELVDLSDVAGEAAVTGLAKGVTSPKLLLGLVYVIKRRTDPEFTLEQAREVKVAALDFAGPVSTNGDTPTATGDLASEPAEEAP